MSVEEWLEESAFWGLLIVTFAIALGLAEQHRRGGRTLGGYGDPGRVPRHMVAHSDLGPPAMKRIWKRIFRRRRLLPPTPRPRRA